MNKQFVISVVVIFVLAMLFGFVIHGAILHDDYKRLADMGVYRSPGSAEPLFVYMIAAHVVIAIAFTWIYRMGRENKPWPGQGVRFGIAVWLLVSVAINLIYYVVTPIPSDLVAKQTFFELISFVILGLAVAFLNRDSAPGRA